MKVCDKKRLYKIGFIFITVIFLLLITTVRSSADEESERSDYSLITDDVEGILESFDGVLPGGMNDMSDISKISDNVGFKFLAESIIDVIRGESGELVTFLLTLFGVALILSFASQLEGSAGDACRGGVSIICAAILTNFIFPRVKECISSLDDVHSFFGTVIPIAAAANALGLSPSTASAQSVGMSLTLQLYSSFSGKFLLSISGIMMTVSALSGLDTGVFTRINKSVKNIFTKGIGLLTTLIGATFSLQSMISSAQDGAAMKTARYAVSNMIPIVGSTVSGALNTLAGGVSYAKGVIGGGSIAVILSLMLSPLITLLLYRLCINVVLFFVGISSGTEAECMLGAFASSIDCVIAVYSLSAVIYIAQLAIFLKGGASIA